MRRRVRVVHASGLGLFGIEEEVVRIQVWQGIQGVAGVVLGQSVILMGRQQLLGLSDLVLHGVTMRALYVVAFFHGCHEGLVVCGWWGSILKHGKQREGEKSAFKHLEYRWFCNLMVGREVRGAWYGLHPRAPVNLTIDGVICKL